MDDAARSTFEAHPVDAPIARVDCDNPSFVAPVRNFLEQHGCAVIVNRKPAIEETYHIIFGSIDFVEEILAKRRVEEKRTLVVVCLARHAVIPKRLHELSARVAVVLATVPSQRDIQELFAFFLLKDTPFVDLRNKQESGKRSPDISSLARESLLGDAQRIASAIAQAFPEPASPVPKRRVRLIWSRAPGRALLGVALVALLPVAWFALCITIVVVLQAIGFSAIRRSNVSVFRAAVRLSPYWIGQASATQRIIGLPFRAAGDERLVRTVERMLSIAREVVTAENAAVHAMDQGQAIAQIFFASPGRPAQEQAGESIPVVLDRIRQDVDAASNALRFAQTQLLLLQDERAAIFSFSFIQERVLGAVQLLDSAIVVSDEVKNLISLYRAGGGFDQKRVYLLLFQNSMELRPTGGFIGSVAAASVENGILADVAIQDVYELDGQLKGHVEPPGPIEDLLGQEHWYLRDSNWDPDFRQSARQAAWFFEKESGTSVDGVVALSVPLVTDLLAAFGPLYLFDYNDRISADNFYGKSLYYTQENFFPGSTQKKDFLARLASATIDRISRAQPKDALPLSRIAMKGLKRKDIQLWFRNQELQGFVEYAGWAGSYAYTDPCQKEGPACLDDRIELVEANMGVNKVNYFITRTIRGETTIEEDGKSRGMLSIDYSNASHEAGSSGGGVYLAHLRVSLPIDAREEAVTIDGKEVRLKSTTPVGSERYPYREDGSIVGKTRTVPIVFTVSPGQKRRVLIAYQRRKQFVFEGNQGRFALFVRKQAGAKETPVSLRISFPAHWQITKLTSAPKADTPSVGFLANQREVRYNTLLIEDTKMTVTFSR